MAVTEQVFVEFIVTGEEGIENTTDTLARTGQIDKKAADQFKQTNAELAKRQKLLSDVARQTATSAQKMGASIEEVHELVNRMLADFVEGMQEGIVDALREAGLEFDEFGKVVEKTGGKASKVNKSLKSELAAVKTEMQQMKLRGEDTGETFDALARRAIQLQNAINDANLELKSLGSDTKNLDGAIEAAGALTGVFAAAQGAEGLLGSQSEELNETLVEVTSSIAILSGFQQAAILLKKESAAVTFLETSAQKVYNVVIGESIGLMAAFRVALATTGIGLLILGIAALVTHLQQQKRELKLVNDEIERNKNLIDADTAAIERNTDEQIARAEAINQKESDIIAIRQHSLDLQRRAILEANANLARQRDEVDNTSEAYFNLNKAIEDNNSKLAELDSKVILENINLERQRRTESLQAIADRLQAELDGATKNSKRELELARQTAQAKAAVELNEAGNNLEKRLAIEAALQKEIRALNLAYAQVQQQDRVAAAERALLAAQQRSRAINARTNQEEIDAQKKVIQENARLALLEEGLTVNKRNQIIEQALADQMQLQKDFTKQTAAEALEDQISRNDAQLGQLNIANDERLRLQEENAIAAAQIEIDANEGLTDKIKAIRAQLNADLRALRLAALEKETDDELRLTTARTGTLRRANERIAADERKTLSTRIAAINQVAALDIANINTRQDALEEAFQNDLISQQEYNLKYQELKDEEAKITEETELRKRELTRQTQQEQIQFALDTASQIFSIIQQFGQQQTDAEQIRIDAQREEIDQLREAGAITEKEALARQKRLDQEERTLKRRQAERDKAIAIFQAIINTAAAVARALAVGGPALAAIVGALGAAQIALIASKPIPKFGKGKKNRYTGPAEIAETGPELLQHDGEMYLAKKRSFVWLGANDKVFNPAETVAIMEQNAMKPYIIKDAESRDYKSVYNVIDYDKLGKVIAGNIPQVGLNVDAEGFTMYTKYQNAIEIYLDHRRSYK
jgi:hypothetical protein